MEGVVRLEVPTPEEGFVNITRKVEAALSGHTGLVYLFVPHTTCGLTVQEGADPTVAQDLLGRLAELAPRHRPQDRHLEGTPTPTSRASSPGSTSSSWRRRGG